MSLFSEVVQSECNILKILISFKCDDAHDGGFCTLMEDDSEQTIRVQDTFLRVTLVVKKIVS